MKTHHKSSLFIYANSSPEMGGGHVLRQLALAQQAKNNGFLVTFIYHVCDPQLIKRINTSGFTLRKLASDLFDGISKHENVNALIVDDYQLSSSQKDSLSRFTCPVVVFDDQTDQDKIIADMIVNSAENISPESYLLRSQAQTLLLGSQYRLIRHEFLTARTKLPSYPSRSRILISFGASDVKQLTLHVIQQLLSIDPRLPLDIIIGGMTELDKERWQQIASSSPNVVIYKNVEDMSALMSQAGLAITSAGGTLYELACLGVPSIALCVVDNQSSALYSSMNNEGYIAFDMSKACAADEMVSMLLPVIEKTIALWQQPEKRKAMSKYLQQKVDGLGSQRIMTTIEKWLNPCNK